MVYIGGKKDRFWKILKWCAFKINRLKFKDKTLLDFIATNIQNISNGITNSSLCFLSLIIKLDRNAGLLNQFSTSTLGNFIKGIYNWNIKGLS